MKAFCTCGWLTEATFLHVQAASDSSEAKKAEEQAKSAPEPPLEKAIIDHFSETLLPGILLYKQNLFIISFTTLTLLVKKVKTKYTIFHRGPKHSGCLSACRRPFGRYWIYRKIADAGLVRCQPENEQCRCPFADAHCPSC